MEEITVVKSKDKYISLADNTLKPENKKIIFSFKLSE